MGRQRSDSAMRLAVACKVLWLFQSRAGRRTVNGVRSHGDADDSFVNYAQLATLAMSPAVSRITPSCYESCADRIGR